MVKKRYLERLPKLKALLEKLKVVVRQEQRILNIDGRYFPCDNAHYALAYVLQGIEQTIMKLVMIKFDDWVKENNIDAHLVAWVHDEFQIEAREDIAQMVADKVASFFPEVATEINLKCPLAGTGKVASDWANSH